MAQFENEIWKPIKENPVYLVSNLGRVKTIDHPIWCKVNNSYSIRKGHLCKLTNKNSKHYWRVGIQIDNQQKHFAVHRLVAEAFIPNPNNLPQVNHIDGNKDNNTVTNLEWCTNIYNMNHSIEHGFIHSEEEREKQSNECHLRKLTNEQVVFIKQLYSTIDTSVKGEKMRFCKDIQKLFNLKSKNTIFWIIQGGTNKFSNQNIVQTTNYNTWMQEYNRINQESKPNKLLQDYAYELGINKKAFNSTYRRLGKNLDKTIEFYKSRNCRQ